MNQLTLPKNFGAMSQVFGSHTNNDNDELGSGISGGYAVMGYRGKVWAIKHQGKELPLLRDDGDGPRGSIEVVIIKSAAPISKIFYDGGYKDGSSEAPTCWSANGVTPDASVQNKQNPTCAGCPKNAWGSRITESGKPGKACADSRRLAIVPLGDIPNELYGGPMLLRVPAASLKDLKAYGDTLNSYGYKYFAVATRISFDAKEAYPKFVFGAIRPLTDDEARQVMELRDDKRVATLLNETVEAMPQQQEAASAAPSIFEQPAAAPAPAPKQEAAPAPKAAAPKAAAKAAPKPAPAPAPEPKADDEGGAVPSSFDDLLDDIL